MPESRSMSNSGFSGYEMVLAAVVSISTHCCVQLQSEKRIYRRLCIVEWRWNVYGRCMRQLLICCIFRARLSFVAALRYQTVEIIVPH